jgi:hypothetical protein
MRGGGLRWLLSRTRYRQMPSQGGGGQSVGDAISNGYNAAGPIIKIRRHIETGD